MPNLITRLGTAARRAAIAKLVARGFDVSETAAKLSKLGYRSTTGKRIDSALIGRDLKVIEDEWIKKSTADIGRHKARQFQELQKIKQQAWKNNDLDLVLKVLDKEMVLLGTKVSAADKETPKYVKNETNQQFNILTDERRNSEILKILETAREREAAVVSGCNACVEATSETIKSV